MVLFYLMLHKLQLSSRLDVFIYSVWNWLPESAEMVLSRHSREVVTTPLRDMVPSVAQFTKSIGSDQVLDAMARVKRSINESKFKFINSEINFIEIK